jgi:multiple sugar transport system permease protein
MASRSITRVAPAVPRITARPRVGTIAKHAFLILVGLAVAYPFYFMVTSAFKDLLEATKNPPDIFPAQLHLENFADAWSRAPWGRYFVNTITISVAVTVGELVTASLAGYAFARMRFPGKGALFTLFLATLMIPSEAVLVPNYVLMSPSKVACLGFPCLNWFDSYQVQIVPFIATAFSIFLMRQFFLSIPNELADAARIDGAGHLRFLWSIVLPLSVPALVTAGLITFLGSWDAFQWPLIVTTKPDFRPVQVGLSAFRQEAGSSYHLLMAASTFVVAPIVVLFLVAQRYLVQGIARTGIRG